jgi:hypothetical protein
LFGGGDRWALACSIATARLSNDRATIPTNEGRVRLLVRDLVMSPPFDILFSQSEFVCNNTLASPQSLPACADNMSSFVWNMATIAPGRIAVRAGLPILGQSRRAL